MLLYSKMYLPRGSALRVDNVVEVLMDSIQQPQEEFLGVVLGIASELKGALRHHVLQHNTGQHKQFCWTVSKTERIL